MPQPGEFVLTKNAPKEPVIIIDDDNEDDSPVEYVEPPVREHKALGVPNVIFPADLPISIVKMIRTYQIKHNCTAVPNEASSHFQQASSTANDLFNRSTAAKSHVSSPSPRKATAPPVPSSTSGL